MPRLSSAFHSLLVVAGLLAGLAVLPQAAVAQSTSTALYEATVPLSSNTERARTEAFAEAMRQVLVQATGRSTAPEEPTLAPLVQEASRYVQQYQMVSTGLMFVSFDARRIERLISAADPSQVSQIRIAVEGIEDVNAYAEVTAFLESLVVMRELKVDELSNQAVVYRAQMRGDVNKLVQAIGQNPRLHSAGAAGVDGSSGELRYRYAP